MSHIIPVQSKYIKQLKELSVLLGPNGYVPTTKYQLGGSDLGIPCYDEKQNKMYLWFGDSFLEPNLIGSKWRSNTVGVCPLDFSEGIKWERFLCDSEGAARQIVPSKKATSPERIEVTTIPTGAVYVNGAQYLFYMSICEWKPGIGWDVNYNGVYKSTDGENFAPVPDMFFACNNKQTACKLRGIDEATFDKHFHPNFAQVFPIVKGDYVYLFGIPGGRKGAVQLARVKKENIENMDCYEYLCSGETFVKGFEGLHKSVEDAVYITDNFVGELSVAYCQKHKKYFMTYLSAKDFSRIPAGLVLRVSDDLIHWSEEELIVTYYDYYKLYGGFMHEKMTSPDGNKMYLLLSQWTSPRPQDNGYNVKLIEVTLTDSIKGPAGEQK